MSAARALHRRPTKQPVQGNNGQAFDENRSLLDLMREVSEETRREILRVAEENNPKPSRKRA